MRLKTRTKVTFRKAVKEILIFLFLAVLAWLGIVLAYLAGDTPYSSSPFYNSPEEELVAIFRLAPIVALFLTALIRTIMFKKQAEDRGKRLAQLRNLRKASYYSNRLKWRRNARLKGDHFLLKCTKA